MGLTLDLVDIFVVIGVVLLMLGVLPFTPAVVGSLIVLSLFEFSFTIGES